MKSRFGEKKTWSFLFCSGLIVLSPPFLAHTTQAAPDKGSIEHVSRSVWRIQTVGRKPWGTAFAVGTRYFVTNAHVILDIFRSGFDNDDIYLSQKGRNTTIQFSQLEVVSLTHDLATFSTNGRVDNFLFSANNFDKTGENSLYSIGYPAASWRLVQQTGSIGEDDLYYRIPVDAMHHKGEENMRGMSGAPVVNDRREIVAVATSFSGNILYGAKPVHLWPVVEGDMGVICHHRSHECLRQAESELWSRVREGNKIAQYQAGSGDDYISSDHDIDLLTQSAHQGFLPAQEELCAEYAKGISRNVDLAIHWCRTAAAGSEMAGLKLGLKYYWGEDGFPQKRKEAFRLIKSAAHRGEAEAQYTFGIFLHNGDVVAKDREAAREWFEKAANNGYKKAQETLEKLHGR